MAEATETKASSSSNDTQSPIANSPNSPQTQTKLSECLKSIDEGTISLRPEWLGKPFPCSQPSEPKKEPPETLFFEPDLPKPYYEGEYEELDWDYMIPVIDQYWNRRFAEKNLKNFPWFDDDEKEETTEEKQHSSDLFLAVNYTSPDDDGEYDEKDYYNNFDDPYREEDELTHDSDDYNYSNERADDGYVSDGGEWQTV